MTGNNYVTPLCDPRKKQSSQIGLCEVNTKDPGIL